MILGEVFQIQLRLLIKLISRYVLQDKYDPVTNSRNVNAGLPKDLIHRSSVQEKADYYTHGLSKQDTAKISLKGFQCRRDQEYFQGLPANGRLS
jgi:hypothetical protein